jgi:hypothetical protein
MGIPNGFAPPQQPEPLQPELQVEEPLYLLRQVAEAVNGNILYVVLAVAAVAGICKFLVYFLEQLASGAVMALVLLLSAIVVSQRLSDASNFSL